MSINSFISNLGSNPPITTIPTLHNTQPNLSQPTVFNQTAPRPLKASIHRSLQILSATGPGGNVIDRPTISPDITKRRETKKRKPPSYRVLLHNDNVNKREYVVSVLLKIVPGYTVEDALNVMQEAHFNGLALVTVCSQELAESYCEGMRNSGLVSTMEPDDGK